MLKSVLVCIFLLAYVVAHPHTDDDDDEEICETVHLKSTMMTPDTQVMEGAADINSMTPLYTTGGCRFMRYGYIGISVWARRGCSGYFRVCYLPAHDEHCYIDHFGSSNYSELTHVELRFAGQVSQMHLINTTSTYPCGFSFTYGYFRNIVFTKHGCYGYFRVCFLPPTALICRLISTDILHRRYTTHGHMVPHLIPISVGTRCPPWHYYVSNNTAYVDRDCDGFFLVCAYPYLCYGRGAGDPHITNTDGGQFGVNPDCMYDLSSTVVSDSNCSYEVFAKMEHRIWRDGSTVTWIKYVEIHAQGLVIILGKNDPAFVFKKAVYIDGDPHNFNASHPRKCIPDTNICLGVSRNRRYVVAKLNCGVKIIWNGNGQVKMKIPSVYSTWIKGLFGNCNLDRYDDLVDANGTAMSDYPTRLEGYRAVALRHVVDDTSGMPSLLPECVP